MSEAPFIDAEAPNAIRVLDKYEVIRRVAQGGMGEIFLARQVGVAGFNRLVILKTLLPELAEQSEIKEQFLDEARIGATLNHPNIVGIHEIGSFDGLYFLVMEFIDGDTLAGLQRAAAKKKASIPWVVSAQIVRDTAKGLDHAHHATDPSTGQRLNIIHRDVTPQNIMVRLDGVVKVVDFGIAKAAGSDPRTAAGEVKGKLSYLSPEQISGASTSVDHRADQFSLGIVLWELCTGRRLFNQKNPLDIFKKILAHDIQPPTTIVPQVPPALERIVMKMLSHDPGDRYARCADAALDLQAWLDSLAGRIDPTSQFVDRLIGEDARARLSDLTPQPVTIVGLKPKPRAPVEELVPCMTCQFPLPARAKFCTECGTPTESSGRVRAAPGRPPTQPGFPEAAPTLVSSTRPASIDGLLGPANPSPGFADPIGHGPMPTTIADDTRARTPKPIALPHVGGAYASSSPSISAGGGALPLDEHVPGMSPIGAPRAKTGSGSGPAAPSPRPPTQPGMPAARPPSSPAIPVARPPSSPAIPVARPPTNPAIPAARPPSTPPTAAVAQSPSTLPRDAGFPAPPTPRTAARIIEAKVPNGRSMSMDDLFAVPGPSSSAVAEAQREVKRKRIFGREPELAQVTQLFVEAASKSRALVFMGESGVGKTALLDAVRGAAEAMGLVVLHAQGSERGLASPLDLVRSLLLGSTTTSDEDAHLTSLIHAAGLPTPVAQRAEAAIVGVPGPPSMSADLDHLLYETAVAKLLGSVARGRPLAILVDDLHRADVASLRVLGLLQQAVTEGVCLIATAHRRFDHPGLPLTELAPLDVAATVEVIEEAAGATVPPDAVRRILEKAEGNPAFARELLEHLLVEGGLVVDGGVAQAMPALSRIAIPPDAAFHTTTRVRCLGNATFEFLKLAASVGVEFSVDEIGAAFARPTEPHEAAARAEKEGILTRAPGGRRLRFKRDLYFDVVLRERRAAELATLHKRLAGAYKGRGVAAAYAEMHQLLLAGEPDAALVGLMHDALVGRGLVSMLGANLPRAVDAVLARAANGQADANGLAALAASATTALTTTAPSDAATLAVRAQTALGSSPVDPALLARLIRARGLAYAQQGEHASAARDLESAAMLAARHGQAALQAEILVELARSLELSGDVPGAVRAYSQSLQGGSPRDAGRWKSGVELAIILARTGQTDRARQFLVDADANARANESSAGYLRCRIGEAIVSASQGQAADAIRVLENTLRAASEQADLVAAAKLHRELAQVLSTTGASEASIGHIQRAAQLAKEVGWSQGVVEILGELRMFGRAGLM